MSLPDKWKEVEDFNSKLVTQSGYLNPIYMEEEPPMVEGKGKGGKRKGEERERKEKGKGRIGVGDEKLEYIYLQCISI